MAKAPSKARASKPKGRKLKVFEAQLGFYDTVVATTSQAKALQIWGTHQNLFADGQAKVTTDPAAIEVATAQPETLLRRPVGSKGRFELEPSSLPDIPDMPKPVKTKSKAGSTTSKTSTARDEAPKPPPPDRSELDAAEAGLKRVDDRRKQEEADLAREQEALDQKVANAQSGYVRDRKAASAALVEARKAYRAKGGRD